jgi:hypothetical protein
MLLSRWTRAFLGWCGGKLAAFWWPISDLARLLWACRAAVLPIVVGVGLIGWTDQARDIVVAGGVPSPANLPTLFAILIAVTIWSTVAWYWARITLEYTFLNPPLVDPQPWQQRWHGRLTVEVPRAIGTLGMLSVAFAFWQAHKVYADALDTASAARFQGVACLYVAVAGLFYLAVSKREPVMKYLARKGIVSQVFVPVRGQANTIVGLSHPVARAFLAVTLLATPVFYLLVVSDPVGMSDGFFQGAIPAALLGFALMVPVGSALVIVSARVRFPFFGATVAWLVAAPILFGDIHDVRTCRELASAGGSRYCVGETDHHLYDKRPTLKQAYYDWWEANAALTPPIQGSTKAPPMIMVATAGGASRAAFWTSQILGELARREEHFADRLFMISGVSGGSLGATGFRSIVEADRRLSSDGKGSSLLKNAAEDASTFIRHDFLGPTFATGMYVDLPSSGLSFLPQRWLPDDRAAALEKAWEQAWEQSGIGAKARLAWTDGFNNAFDGERPWPVLALNGTAVEKGKRIITSNVKFWRGPPASRENMSGGINRYDTFTLLQSDIPISTAVTMSARFPVISPTGGLRDDNDKMWARVTDGGLFENFGALTIDEVLRYLVFRLSDVQKGDHQAVPMAILISSDPSLDPLHLREDGALNVAVSDCARVGENHRPDPVPNPGNNWPECPVDAGRNAALFVDPVKALYDGRVARGEVAATALLDGIVDTNIPLRDRLNKSVPDIDALQARLGLDDHTDFFHFRQCRVDHLKGPTMSWHDSDETWMVLRKMLGLEPNATGAIDDPCGNGAEFFRLCMRLARVTGAEPDDIAATKSCAQRWPRPADWECKTGPSGRPRCGLPLEEKAKEAELAAPKP